VRLTGPTPGVNFTLVTDLSWKRYGEVLLVEVGASGPQATVYNSFPLNDCPAELWSKLDPQGRQERKAFGGIEMIKQATVALSSMDPAPSTVNDVSRNTVFVFNAGEEVYELIDPEGQRWVMQARARHAG
jgi:hypothetical protein